MKTKIKKYVIRHAPIPNGIITSATTSRSRNLPELIIIAFTLIRYLSVQFFFLSTLLINGEVRYLNYVDCLLKGLFRTC